MFEFIVGQDTVKKYFEHEINNNSLSSGYILSAPKNYGKEFIARNIATEITSPMYIKYLVPTDGRKNVSVDDVRTMQEEAYTTTYSSTRVYIIPNAEKLSNQCQNAMLKLLEEPPNGCIFIFLTTAYSKILSTIRSRCVHLPFKPYTHEQVLQLASNGSETVDPQLLAFCDTCIGRYEYVKSDEFKEIMQLAFNILVEINQMHPARIFVIYSKAKAYKENFNELINILQRWFYSMFLIKNGFEENLTFAGPYANILVNQANQYTEAQIIELIKELDNFEYKCRINCNLEMQFNKLLLDMRIWR